MRELLAAFSCTRLPSKLRVWSTGPFEVSVRAQTVLRHLQRPDTAGVDVLKQSARRAVLRIRDYSPQQTSLIVKGFPLPKLESRLKYKRYGLSEFVHYQEARRQQIPAPACYAYFEIRSWGLVTANGVLIEDLGQWRSLAQWLAAEPQRQSERLAQAIPVLCRLFETGVNHIDPSPQNMLLAPAGSEARLIDWQYCSIVAPRQPAQLLLQATHFLHYAKVPGDSPVGRHWVEQLWTAANPPAGAGSLASFVAAVGSLQRRGRVSASERLALTLDANTARLLRRGCI